MHPTTTQHINPRAKQSPVGTQHVALRITSANTCTNAPVETLRSTSPTHHTSTRDTGDVARYVSTSGNGHANQSQHSAITTQHVALRVTSANTCTDAPVETLRATSPTHHAPTRKNIEGKHALPPCPAGLDPASHPRWMHQTAWDCGATPARTRKATSLHQE